MTVASYTGEASGGTLTLSNNGAPVAALKLAGNYTGAKFTTVLLGNGTTQISLISDAWKSASSGLWSTGANWSLGSSPTAGQFVLLPSVFSGSSGASFAVGSGHAGAGEHVVRLSVSSALLAGLQLGSSGGGSIYPVLNVQATGVLNVAGAIGFIDGSGQILLTGGSVNAAAINFFRAPGNLLSGYGTVAIGGEIGGAGTIMASGGLLDVSGNIDSGVGLAVSGGTLQIDSRVAAGAVLTFGDSASIVRLADDTDFAGVLWGLTVGSGNAVDILGKNVTVSAVGGQGTTGRDGAAVGWSGTALCQCQQGELVGHHVAGRGWRHFCAARCAAARGGGAERFRWRRPLRHPVAQR